MLSTHHSSRGRLWFVAAGTAALTVASLSGPVTTPARAVDGKAARAGQSASVKAAVPVPAVAWRPCRDGFECADVPVPLDYDRPGGEQIAVSVIRLPAASPGRRIGSLFLNPGGPGGSGVDAVRGGAQFLPLQLRGRFDIVGFDPRGILRSTPLRCYRTFGEAIADLPPFAYPTSEAQVMRLKAADLSLVRACRSHAGPILRHMSTADVARDMDLLRRAVGDRSLNYLGFSYGTELGQTYANMFPRKVGAMVIDGVLDPRAWAGTGPRGRTVPVGTRLASADGSRKTLGEFFRLCDAAGRSCALSGHSRERYAALLKAARHHRIPHLRKSDLIAITAGALYVPFIWPELARFLRDLEREASPARVETSLATLRDRLGLGQARQEAYPNIIEGFPGVLCADATNPDSYRAYSVAAVQAKRAYGYFGPLWNWTGSMCAVWPESTQEDRYTGPWTARTENPVLVVGNFFDPATPYEGAVTASRLLPNSRLLSYAGWGHTAVLSGNFCVDAAVTTYLTTTKLPPAGKVCRPNGSPFGPLQARSSSDRGVAGVAATMPPAVREAFRTR
jgi:pimeloyl-ACP methyl ester carboxylesterase